MIEELWTKIKNNIVSITIALTIIVVSNFLIFVNHSDSYLEMTFFDVGQGDSILIKSPGGKYILIDAGSTDQIVSQLSQTLAPNKKFIDMGILTHPHNDHLGGFNYLKDYYTFGKFLQMPVEHNSDSYINWLNYLDSYNVDVSSVYSGDNIYIEDDFTLDILWPDRNISLEDYSLNDTSIVFMLEYQNFTALFMGDAEIAVEDYILNNYNELDCNLLKVGHHGSDTSSSNDFLNFVSPEISVISVGENNQFGHPSDAVLDKLESLDSEIYRTDVFGTIKVISDGDTYWLDK